MKRTLEHVEQSFPNIEPANLLVSPSKKPRIEIAKSVLSPSKKQESPAEKLFSSPYTKQTYVANKNLSRVSKAGQFNIYTLKTLSELFKNTERKKVRFLLTTELQLRFAEEGLPSKTIPAHFQMVADKIKQLEATCLAAGDISFNEAGLIVKINHKSGDFQPDWKSLKIVLAILIANKAPLSDEIALEKLNASGGIEAVYEVKTTRLAHEISELLPMDELYQQLIKENQEVTVYHFSTHPELVKSESKRANFFARRPLFNEADSTASLETSPKDKKLQAGFLASLQAPSFLPSLMKSTNRDDKNTAPATRRKLF